ncbi:MAG: hypothetical protein VX642_10675 [Bdellovibrionota bacterium]|nr:hypothetical protein [Bdellovibrionota bacterium]
MKTIILFFLSLSCFAAKPSNSIQVSIPEGANGKYILVIPAKKYSMKGELFQKIKREALRRSYAVLQFDWSFYTKNIEPTKSLRAEARELNELIDYFQETYGFQKNELIIIAKSFGSRVLSKIRTQNLGPIALVTPNCDSISTFYKTYGKLLNHKQKMQISISVDDPYCNVEQIYNSASYFTKKITLYTSTGDHNFVSKENVFNQDIMISQLVNWIYTNP